MMGAPQNSSPPDDLVRLCDNINAEYLDSVGAKVEPWLMDDREWRIALISKEGKRVHYLCPEAADGHTYRLLAWGMSDSYEDGLRAGLELAHRRVCDMLRTAIFNDPLPADPWGKPYLTKK